MPISSYVSCLETNSIMSCSYSEVPAAQQKIARRGSGEPVDCVGGWPLGFSGAKQLTVWISPGPSPLLNIRHRRLIGGHRQLRGGRWPVRELWLEMMKRWLNHRCSERDFGGPRCCLLQLQVGAMTWGDCSVVYLYTIQGRSGLERSRWNWWCVSVGLYIRKRWY